MADNVGYTPGSGATVAADEIGGVLFQRVKPVTGVDGTAVDVSATNPMPMAAYGELIEAVEALRMTVSALASHLQFMDSARRAKVVFDTNSSLNQVNQVTSVLGVTTVSAVSSVKLQQFPSLVLTLERSQYDLSNDIKSNNGPLRSLWGL